MSPDYVYVESRDDLLNMNDVAAAFRVSVSTVRRLHSSGALPFRLVGRILCISRGELDNWVVSQTIAETARRVVTRPPPPPPRFTLYRFFDASGELLYVGITATGVSRWAAHAKDKPWWIDVATVGVEHLGSLAELQAAELTAIRTEGPRYNGKPSQ